MIYVLGTVGGGGAIDLKLEHQFAQHDEHGEELISHD